MDKGKLWGFDFGKTKVIYLYNKIYSKIHKIQNVRMEYF